ncbi:hypothetical protein MSAN_01366400 [Mycena sanguinolenta]|uniref:Uncharacterized protein n=1 Tax=Mycena sanguinolenta TaxID=230812 RepID=A0A8H6Y8U2_9AGAR|nr:hypothetical protein MSAN_01366400 [Mycena sanguinolenta]
MHSFRRSCSSSSARALTGPETKKRGFLGAASSHSGIWTPTCCSLWGTVSGVGVIPTLDLAVDRDRTPVTSSPRHPAQCDSTNGVSTSYLGVAVHIPSGAVSAPKITSSLTPPVESLATLTRPFGQLQLVGPSVPVSHCFSLGFSSSACAHIGDRTITQVEVKPTPRAPICSIRFTSYRVARFKLETAVSLASELLCIRTQTSQAAVPPRLVSTLRCAGDTASLCPTAEPLFVDTRRSQTVRCRSRSQPTLTPHNKLHHATSSCHLS